MSIETANAARFKKGLTVLTPLEGELLEALEAVGNDIMSIDHVSVKTAIMATNAITAAHLGSEAT